MRIIRQTPQTKRPRLSIVLLDWSVRESLHTLDYLAKQDVDRDEYEIVWIEYFNRESDDLKERISIAESVDKPSPVDTWIVMDVPEEVCHHKHLMYNVGLLASRGELVCYCDSDAMFRPGFVRSVFESFDADPKIVLHHDQVRNHLPEYYPFEFPAFEDVTGFGCYQWVNGKPLGLWDQHDPLHTRNYGASMTARREDLIAIGGADMHTDYLGHVCGPYEMTFRLVNHGLREVWHQDEFLYHTWHPGQAGTVDYCGPHDGLHMSTTALEAIESGRVEPVVEHPAVALLRTGQADSDDLNERLDAAVPPEWLQTWHRDQIKHLPAPNRDQQATPQPPFGKFMTRGLRLRLLPIVAKLAWNHLRYSARWRKSQTARFGDDGVPRNGKLRSALLFARYLIRVCWLNMVCLKQRGVTEVRLVGDGIAIRLCQILAKHLGITTHTEPLEGADDLPIVIAALADATPFRKLIKAIGVQSDRIIAIPC